MPAYIARWCLLVLTVVLLAVWLPALGEMMFAYRFGKTQLFYSPVEKKFIYTELLGEGHDFIYRNQDGADYTRQEFEMRLPFIYYKNMELWGKLPLEIDGRRFDKASIMIARQVLELKPEELPGHAPRVALYPLLETHPGRAGLSFPEDIVRPNAELTFINSDENRIDVELTRTFTDALQGAGFRFPVRATFTRVSILKGFDAGFFLLDADGALFHLKRRDGKPQVAKVPLPEGLSVRYVKVTENANGEVLALLLDAQGTLHLVAVRAQTSTGQTSVILDYRLIPLPLPGYKADSMEVKILFNPLYRAAVYSDDTTVHAVAMTPDYRVIDSYSRPMAMARPRLVDTIGNALAPFHIALGETGNRYVALSPHVHGLLALPGMILCALLAGLYLRLRGAKAGATLGEVLLVVATGLYGLIALFLFPPERNGGRYAP